MSTGETHLLNLPGNCFKSFPVCPGETRKMWTVNVKNGNGIPRCVMKRNHNLGIGSPVARDVSWKFVHILNANRFV